MQDVAHDVQPLLSFLHYQRVWTNEQQSCLREAKVNDLLTIELLVAELMKAAWCLERSVLDHPLGVVVPRENIWRVSMTT